MLEQLHNIYEEYIRDAAEVVRKSRPTDGLFGMGEDPRKHRCHEEFYDRLSQWIQNFLSSCPEEERVFQAARWIIGAPVELADNNTYWMMYAAHGLCGALVSGLTAENCARLRIFYDDHYPKWDRLPVHKALYKALKKGAAEK